MELLNRASLYPPLRRGLTGWWPFDDDLLDHSGRGHHGIGPLIQRRGNWVDPYGGTAKFDGAYVDTRTPISAFMSASTGSFAVWIYPTLASPVAGGGNQGRAIVQDGSGADGEYFGISRTTVGGQDKLWAYVYDGAYRLVSGSYTPDRWNHIVWVHSAGVLFLYVNGTLSGSISAGNIASMTLNVRFGVRYDSSTGLFSGLMRDARIYNRALNAREALLLYNSKTWQLLKRFSASQFVAAAIVASPPLKMGKISNLQSIVRSNNW